MKHPSPFTPQLYEAIAVILACIALVALLLWLEPSQDGIVTIADFYGELQATFLEFELNPQEAELLDALREWLVQRGWLPAGETTLEQEREAVAVALEYMTALRQIAPGFKGVGINRPGGKIRLWAEHDQLDRAAALAHRWRADREADEQGMEMHRRRAEEEARAAADGLIEDAGAMP